MNEQASFLSKKMTALRLGFLTVGKSHYVISQWFCCSFVSNNCFNSTRWVSRWYYKDTMTHVWSNLWTIWQSLNDDIFHQSQESCH